MANGEHRAIVQHLLAQHRSLDGLLCEARADLIALHGPDADARPGDVAAVLRRIGDAIAHHFSEEEAGGCMEEAVLQCPKLSAQAKLVEAEHAELLATIDALIAQVESPQRVARDWLAFEQAFEVFYNKMRAHEAAENELIRQGLGAELDAEECFASPMPDF